MCSVIARLTFGTAAAPKACLVFLPLWLIGAAINMYIGVSRAGYGVAEEAPIFVVVFSVPAAIALLLWRRLRRE